MKKIGEVLKLRERSTGIYLKINQQPWIKLNFKNNKVTNNLTAKQLNFVERILQC